MKLFLTLVLLSLAAAPQEPASEPKFEVASVKLVSPPRTGDAALMGFTASKRRIAYRNITLAILVSMAYGVGSDSIDMGRERWIDTTPYDVVAVSPADATKAQMNAILRTLLTERFGLKAHMSSKDAAALELYVDPKGHKLQKAAEDAVGNPSLLPGRIVASHISMATLAGLLRLSLKRPVVDKTGIDGEFDVDVEWTPDATGADVAVAETGDSVYTALRDKPGLRLRPGRTAVETLVIDRAVREPIEP